MTREDIIRMAREAGLNEPGHPFNPWSASQDALERFAALVAAAERGACHKVALNANDQGSVNQRAMQKRIAAAIRARSKA